MTASHYPGKRFNRGWRGHARIVRCLCLNRALKVRSGGPLVAHSIAQQAVGSDPKKYKQALEVPPCLGGVSGVTNGKRLPSDHHSKGADSTLNYLARASVTAIGAVIIPIDACMASAIYRRAITIRMTARFEVVVIVPMMLLAMVVMTNNHRSVVNYHRTRRRARALATLMAAE